MIKQSYLLIFILIVSLVFTGMKVTTPKTYSESMIELLSDMNTYAKDYNPKFAMIANGGYNLYTSKAPTQKRMFKAVDGVLIEEAFSNGDKKTMQAALRQAIKHKKKAFTIEYKSFKSKKGIVSFKGKKKLNKIPKFRSKKVYDVTKLSDVKNFMIILDPDKYKSKKKYLKTLKNTDYDLIFVDLFYDGKMLTANDIYLLKFKRNGGRRLVCSYLSVGEAEDYRYYWKSKWNKKKPKWIVKENKEWKGNYKVKYWDPKWQTIIYGYMNRILKVGFDGVYLDVIDAYEYFEER